MHTDQVGRVEGILIRPKRKQPPVRVNTWDPSSDADHGRPKSKRAVTLIQKEHLAVIAALSGTDIPWEQTRRNVLVSGINLLTLVGHRFQIGTVILEGTVLVDPCHQMEAAFGKGAYAAMLGHGGIGARIIESGTLREGDEIRWMGPIPHED